MDKILLQYGVLGVVVLGLAYYILRRDAAHKKERKELIDMNEQNFKRVNEITDENNRVLRENTNILSGLKTLLENRTK